jgi:hypothetical protein
VASFPYGLRAGFYVVDALCGSDRSPVVAGPFSTASEAEQDRREYNIAEDCIVVQVTRLGDAREVVV